MHPLPRNLNGLQKEALNPHGADVWVRKAGFWL